MSNSTERWKATIKLPAHIQREWDEQNKALQPKQATSNKTGNKAIKA